MTSSSRPWSRVPVGVADVLRPVLPGTADRILAELRTSVPDYDRPFTGDFGRAVGLGVTFALDTFLGLLGRDVGVGDLAVYSQLGRGELRSGRTLDALQSAYRIGARLAWRAFVDHGERSGLRPAELYALAEAIFAYIDELSAASVEGYAQEQAALAGALQTRRHRFVEMFTHHLPPDPLDVERAAGAAAWPFPGLVAALAVEGVDAVAVARRLPGSIGAATEPAALVLVADPEGPGQAGRLAGAVRGHRAVLGPSVPLAELHLSVRRVLAAWPLHESGRLGPETLAVADEHLVELLLAADPAVMQSLTARALAPLDGLPANARARAVETLRAWLDAHGDVPAASAVLHLHPQGVRYRLAGLRERFGDALDDPTQRLLMTLALRADQP